MLIQLQRNTVFIFFAIEKFALVLQSFQAINLDKKNVSLSTINGSYMVFSSVQYY